MPVFPIYREELLVAGADAPSWDRRNAYAVCDGTDDHEEISAALARVDGGRVRLTSTTATGVPFDIGATITLGSGKGLIGSGSRQASDGGTELKAANGLNADVIATNAAALSEWWHQGYIADLRVNGNKANNTSGYGINVGQMGEASRVERVLVTQCKSGGIKVARESTPSSLMDISASQNDGFGMEVANFRRHATIINLTGDQNTGGLLKVSGDTGSPISSVTVIGLKAERATSSTTHDPVVLIEDYAGAVLFIGGSIDGGTNTGTSAVKRTAPTSKIGRVGFLQTAIYNYTNQLEDTASTRGLALGTGVVIVNYFTDDWRGVFRNAGNLRAGNGTSGQVNIGDIGGGLAGLLLGSSGDVNLHRPSADVLKTADRFVAADGITTKTKAGTPTDADFAQTPENGTMVIDTSTSKIWVRISGTWKATAALT